MEAFDIEGNNAPEPNVSVVSMLRKQPAVCTYAGSSSFRISHRLTVNEPLPYRRYV